MNKLVSIFVVSAVLSGCQTGYMVKFDSSPQSAVVTCGSIQQGYTPIKAYYPKAAIVDGILRTQPCKATWLSGEEAWFDTAVPVKDWPKGVQTTVNRPDNNNISVDIQFDYQRKQNAAAYVQKANEEAINSINNMNNSNRKTWCNTIGTQVMCF